MSNSRLEKFIYAICSMEVSDLPAPLSRIEILWNCLITGETPDFEPQSRNEQYLMAMLGLYDLENLPTPMSRGEKLLYKIAMGETDLSDVPAYLSRYEELLGYLAENGGVGDFEYILQTLNQRLSTLYSTKERPMKQAVIKGDTLVNELPRPSLKNTMTNVGSQKLNQGYDAVNVVDGEFKSAILKGQTLVNLWGTKREHFFTNGTFENSVLTSNGWCCLHRVEFFKPNTEYTLITNIISISDTNTYFKANHVASNGIFKTETNELNKVGIYVEKVVSYDDFTGREFSARSLVSGGGTIQFNMVVLEGDYTNIDIPYFTGMQSVKLPVLKATGKNLINSEIIAGWLNTSNGEINNLTSETTCATKDLIKVKPATQYSVYKEYDKRVLYAQFNEKQEFINFGTYTHNRFTTDSNAVYVRLFFETPVNEELKVMLYEGGYNSNISYEPYKSNILSCLEPVTLRKVGDVEDEFDALTGQVTKRVGEVTFDGSENWSGSSFVSTNHYCAYTRLSKSKNIMSLDVICDSLPTKDILSSSKDYEGCAINSTNSSDSPGNLVIKIAKSKLSSESSAGIKEYLSQNPITVQYQLATPTTKQVNPTITDQDGATQTKLHSFNDGHLSVTSQGLLPSVVNYEVPTNNSYYLPDMLTLGAQYTSRGSADCNATIDGKLLALGKNKTFTTPSSVTDKLMVLDAPVDDLMFIKGDQTAKDFGYFEGMKSVVLSNKMPVLTATGKNLIDERIWDTETVEEGYDCLLFDGFVNIDIDGKVGNPFIIPVNIEKGKTYTLKCKNKATTYFNIFYLINDGALSTKQELVRNDRLGSFVDTFLTFTANMDYKYLYIDTGNNGAYGYIVKDTLQIEEGSTATSYEPYKSNILSTPEDLELRGIGDVQDTLDCLTGEVTERIGEIMLDGSEDWIGNANFPETNDYKLMQINLSFPIINATNTNILCDKIRVTNYSAFNSKEYEFVSAGKTGATYVLFVKLNKSKLISADKNGFNDYFSKNPTTVYFTLLQNSVKTVDLTTVDQDGQPTKLKTFNDITHVEIKADNLIPSVDLEVATKISKTLSTMGPQQLDISETQNRLGQTIDEQTENTDAAMIATTEIYEQTL